MTAPTSIVTVTRDEKVMRRVREAVNSSSKPQFCSDLYELVLMLEQHSVQAVLVDMDAQVKDVLGEMESILGRYANTRLIVLATEQSPDLMLQAMKLGARHFMLKSNLDAELPDVLSQLSTSAGEAVSTDGHGLITILSAGGGSGATTIAINLADELQRLAGQPSLLIDMDLCHGGAAGYLAVHAQYGIADILADGARIDSHLIRSTAVSFNDNIHLLASPATSHNVHEGSLNFAHLPRALRGVRQTYSYAVVDAPHVTIDIADTLARMSVVTFIVLESDVEDVRIARHLLQSLVARGIAPDRILPVVNRFHKRHQAVPFAEIQNALGSKRIVRLSNDYSHVTASMNSSKPLSESAPRSILRKEIAALAGMIHEAATSGHPLEKVH